MKLRWLIPLLFVLPAFGAGGTCPSAAAYYQPASNGGFPTLTTLSTLGITSCYFVAPTGSESNNGTSESTPWLYAPFMPNSTHSSCTTLTSGIGIIVEGGSTYHGGNSSATPYMGGGWLLNSGCGPHGSNTNPIYLGVDTTWYSGASFARPIITMDNPPSTSQTLSSCTYPTASNVIDISGGSYYIIDDFELTGVCTTSANWNVIYMAYGSLSGWSKMFRLYIHGWSHVGFSNPNNCTASSTCMSAWRGSTQSGDISNGGDWVELSVLDGSDSDPVPMELCFCGAYFWAYNYFNNFGQFVHTTAYQFHDNQVFNFVDNGHANLYEGSGDSSGKTWQVIYNNAYGSMLQTPAVNSNVGYWPYYPVGDSMYFFNNVDYLNGPMEWFNICNNSITEGDGRVFNNTFQFVHRTSGVDNYGPATNGHTCTFTNANDHYISDDISGSVLGMYSAFTGCSLSGGVMTCTGGSTGTGTDTDSSTLTNSQATTDGYTSSQPFAYSPTSGSSPTVGAGTNLTGSNCANINTAASTYPDLANAYSACLNSTTYGCSYSASGHTVGTCPALTPTARPSTGAWDVGAYEYPLNTGSGSFTCSPATVPANHSNNIALACTGVGTSWTSGTTFTVSSPATFVSKSFSSSTGYTVTITTSSGTGVSTITDTTDSISTNITVATATLSVSPNSGTAGSSGCSTGCQGTVTFTGANTIWSSESPTGLFSVSGGTGSSIGTPTVSSNTSATALLTWGSAAATETLEDTSTTATASFTVNAPSTATVTTGTVGSITTNSAIVTGSSWTCTPSCVNNPTSEGVCYGTSPNPTTSGTCTSDGTATPFNSTLTGLAFSTLYYFRAFATNSVGTAYGSDQSFTTVSTLSNVSVTGDVTMSGTVQVQ
jgi:hypothetical protein